MAAKWDDFAREMKQDGGWRVVLVSGIGFALGVNVLSLYTLGAFVAPLEQAFGWSRAQVQGSLVFLVLATLVGGWGTGWLTDRYGVRRIALGGQICLAVGLALLPLSLSVSSPRLWVWYAVWFVMSLTAMGTGPITWTRAIAGWFDGGRGTALALALCTSGIAAIILPPVTVGLIEAFGWRTAYWVLAGIVACVAIPATVWLLPAAPQRPRRRQQDESSGKEREADGMEVGKALSSYRFWLLMATTVMLGFAITGTIANLIPMLTDEGLSPALAASLLGVMGGALIVGRLVVGYALDRIWAPAVATMVFPLAGMSCLVLAYGSTDYPVLFVAVALFGFATGAEFDFIPYIVTRYFGLKRYSQIYALQWIGWTLSAGVAPAIFGHTYDVMGSYRTVLWVAALFFLTSPLFLLVLGRYPQWRELQPA
jgi:OFA family oxalate/formate antiporter-like MFS transporter